MGLHQKFAGAAAAAACIALSAPAGAVVSTSGPTPTGATYTISLPDYAVTDIVVFTYGAPFNYFTQGSPTNPLSAATPGPTTLSVTYPTPAGVPIPGFTKYVPSETFLLGVATDLQGDAAGQQHLVVFTNDSFAASAQSIAFGTLFPNTNETALINDLVTQTGPGDIFTFAGGDALTGPNGSIAFTPGDDFTAVAFSNGQIIGTGTSSYIAGVPEPAAWAMLILGLGAVGVAMRRRRALLTA